MCPFWTSFFDNLKNCGQNATLFMAALGGFLAFLGLIAVIFESGFLHNLMPALPGISLLFLAWGWGVLRKRQAIRRQRALRSPLSRDELRVARSKLLKEQDRTTT